MEILVIPDVKAMDRAIEAHLATCQIIKQAKNKSKCTKELNEYLIKQVLYVASAKNKSGTDPSTKNASQANHHSSIIDPNVS